MVYANDAPIEIEANPEFVRNIASGIYARGYNWGNGYSYVVASTFFYIQAKYKGVYWGVRYYGADSNGSDVSGVNSAQTFGSDAFDAAKIFYIDPKTGILYDTPFISFKYCICGMCANDKKLFIIGSSNNAAYSENSGVFQSLELPTDWKPGDTLPSLVNLTPYPYSGWFQNSSKYYMNGFNPCAIDKNDNIWVASVRNANSLYWPSGGTFTDYFKLYRWNGSIWEDKSSLLYTPAMPSYFAADTIIAEIYKINNKIYISNGFYWNQSVPKLNILSDDGASKVESIITNPYAGQYTINNETSLTFNGNIIGIYGNQEFWSVNVKNQCKKSTINTGASYQYSYYQSCSIKPIFVANNYVYCLRKTASYSTTFNTSYAHSQYWGWSSPPGVQNSLDIICYKIKSK